MTSEASTRKHSHHCGSQEDWDRAKEQWNEFRQNFTTKMNESRVWGHRADKHMIEVKLPNGREFSFTLGHIIFAGLALWLLPFNLVILAVLLYVAYRIGNENGDQRKRHDDDKPKRKTGEPAQEFEVYKV